MKGRSRLQGFTLLEVISAVFVFLMGVVGVISLFAAGTALHKGAQDKTLSALVIEQVISQIDTRLSRGDFRGPEGNLQPKVQGFIAGHERYGYEAELREEGSPGRSMVVARVRITWQDKGVMHGEAFDYLFRPGPSFQASVTSLIKESK
jgi:type II secretory pathway component PulJ